MSRKQLISLIKMLLDHRVQLMASDLSHYTKPHFYSYILLHTQLNYFILFSEEDSIHGESLL